MTIAAFTFLGTTILFCIAWYYQWLSTRALRDELATKESEWAADQIGDFDWPKESNSVAKPDNAA